MTSTALEPELSSADGYEGGWPLASMRLNDVIVGDVVTRGSNCTSHWNSDYLVVAVVKDRLGSTSHVDMVRLQDANGYKRGHRVTGWYESGELRVARRPAGWTAPAGSKRIDAFPHACTRCGRPAYVGLFEIQHKDEAAASGCPARR